jgi:hypothetical protein
MGGDAENLTFGEHCGVDKLTGVLGSSIEERGCYEFCLAAN